MKVLFGVTGGWDVLGVKISRLCNGDGRHRRFGRYQFFKRLRLGQAFLGGGIAYRDGAGRDILMREVGAGQVYTQPCRPHKNNHAHRQSYAAAWICRSRRGQ